MAMIFNRDTEMLLGLEESQILQAIAEGFGDIKSIHYVTGIPVPCIEYKIAALEGLGWIKQEPPGFVIQDGTRIETSP